MQKKYIDRTQQRGTPGEPGWLELETLARIEITSEEPSHPIESALIPPGAQSGWLAAQPGEQTIRLIFHEPQRIKRIWLLFTETETERTQEFVLRWSPDGRSYREIVRQQWNFSPGGATREAEDYHVSLSGVSALELIIVPDKAGGDARASLTELRME